MEYIIKSRSVKYLKRTGVPGNYKYTYKIVGKHVNGKIGMWDMSSKNPEYKYFPTVNTEDVKKISGIAKKMMAVEKLPRAGHITFTFKDGRSGESIDGWQIGLKLKTYPEALGEMIHEIGHMTQKDRPGGMMASDYAGRRVAHEKQAWMNGFKLFKKAGFLLSKFESEHIKQDMKTKLGQYYEHFKEKHGG